MTAPIRSFTLSTESFLVDAHVHAHPPHRLEDVFEAADANLQVARASLGLSSHAPGCLMLAETSGTDRFTELRRLAGRQCGAWQVTATDEDISILVRREGRGPLVIVSGFQIVTQERLEVLVLACAQRVPDGQPLEALIDAALAARAVVVVPWGFGKWWFGRGATVRRLLASKRAQSLYVGDNGGRLSWAPLPRLFRAAIARGIPILPGSDALPLSGQLRKIGRYGFVLGGTLNLQEPARAVATTLAASRAQPRVFGHRENLPGFLRSQLGMQLHKRRASWRVLMASGR